MADALHNPELLYACLISRRARHGLVPASRVLTSGSFNRSSTSFHREIHPGEQGVIALIVAQTA
ncbi:MAG: hypothetical protein E6J82_14385 [Deltaproteobacteria bacterium]|nr:MAG: hypothetical protein E6J82_14385 [Deltaproteobacteria bacterium]